MPPPTAATAPKPSGLLKKVPTWGWLVLGGSALGLGYALYRDRHSAAPSDVPPGEDAIDPALLSSQPSPAGFVSNAAGPVDSGETVGAVGQTALETSVAAITGLFDALPGIITSFRDPVFPQSLPQTPAPGSAGGSSGAAPAPPKAPGAPHVGPGVTYHTAGGKHNKFFPQAYRLAAASKSGHNHDFNVFYYKPHKDERWRYNDSSHRYSLVATGNWGG